MPARGTACVLWVAFRLQGHCHYVLHVSSMKNPWGHGHATGIACGSRVRMRANAGSLALVLSARLRAAGVTFAQLTPGPRSLPGMSCQKRVVTCRQQHDRLCHSPATAVTPSSGGWNASCSTACMHFLMRSVASARLLYQCGEGLCLRVPDPMLCTGGCRAPLRAARSGGGAA